MKILTKSITKYLPASMIDILKYKIRPENIQPL